MLAIATSNNSRTNQIAQNKQPRGIHAYRATKFAYSPTKSMVPKKILFATCIPPWPSNNGGRQRTLLLLQALRGLADVDVILFHLGEFKDSDAAMCRMEALKMGCRIVEHIALENKHTATECARLPGIASKLIGSVVLLRNQASNYRRIPAAQRKLQRVVDAVPYDAIVARYPVTALRLGLDAIKYNGLKLVDVDDVPWRVVRSEAHARQKAKWTTRILDELRFMIAWQVTRRRMLAFDHLWVTKQSDLNIGRNGSISVLPNIPFGIVNAVKGANSSTVSKRIIMVGSFWYGPNRDGLFWFVRNVWPTVKAHVPDCEFVIIGEWPELLVAEPELIGAAGIRVRGQADQLAPEYYEASLAIAPILTGGGTKIKVLEALAYARPCVATPHAVEGFERLHSLDCGVLVASSPEAFASHCIDLLRKPLQASLLGQRGKELVEQFWSKDAFFEAVHNPLRKLVAKAKSRQCQ